MIKDGTAYQERIEAYRHQISCAPELLPPGLTKEYLNEKEEVFCDINRYHLNREPSFRRSPQTHADFISQLALMELDLQIHLGYVMRDLLKIGDNPNGKGPFIFCAPHLGGYLHIPTSLKLLGYETVTVTSNLKGENVIVLKESDPNYKQKKDLFESENINALTPDAVFRIYAAYKRGKSILFFLDCFQTSLEDKRNIEVELGNFKLSIPSNVFDIAQKLQIPLVPVFAPRRPSFEIDIEIHAPIQIPADNEMQRYLAIQSYFDLFEQYLPKYHSQWQELSVIHRRATGLAEKAKTGIKHNLQTWTGIAKRLLGADSRKALTLNYEQYSFYQKDEEFYLVNINSFKAAKISSYVYSILQKFHERPISRKESRELFGQNLLTDLINKSIIKPCNDVYIQ